MKIPRSRPIVSLACVAGASLLLLAGCGDSGPKTIVGSWKVTEATGMMAKSNKGVSYKFDDGGKVVLGGFNKCTYTHKKPDLAIKCGSVTIKWKAELKPDGDTLVLTNPSAKQVLTLKRS